MKKNNKRESIIIAVILLVILAVAFYLDAKLPSYHIAIKVIKKAAVYSLVAVSLIDALANDKRDVQVVNVKNNGTLPFMADDDIVEVAAVIGSDGAHPVPVTEHINDHIIGLMRVVKTYEKYTVKAAIKGSDEDAIKGLLVHPLVGDCEKAVNCFNELKEAHKEYLPQYFNK